MSTFSKWIPNLLSLSRLPLGAATAYAAIRNHWGWALIFFLIGLAADLTDGLLARILCCASQNGQLYDDIGDTGLAAGAFVAVVWTGIISWPTGLIMASVFAFMAVVTVTCSETRRTWQICYAGTYYYSIGFIAWFLSVCFYKIYGLEAVRIMPIAIPTAVLLAYLKRGTVRKYWQMLLGK
ncbi:MAG: CDP-alcohol phosphatidyltransferase family protein [Candidatus Moranbacteria bacterium]|nr:CDP-alcohol phosphatidyltransferase family protein [Candidatus Moranbacteria bacterium]